MSRANKQSLMMLASVAQLFHLLYKGGYYEKEMLPYLCKESFHKTLHIISTWPNENCSFKNPAEYFNALDSWVDEVDKERENLEASSIVYMIDKLVTDLESKLKNRAKLDLLSTLHEPIKDLIASSGDSGTGDNGLLDSLYEKVGWER